MFSGSLTALITPFRNGKVDYLSFERFVEWQIAEGSHGVVPCGTTGEAPTLSLEEHRQLVSRCVSLAKGRCPVIAGAGSNATEEAIFLARQAEKAGADAALVVAPYYNRPSQEGLFHHFRAIHDATGLPLVLYNIPGRTGIDIANTTLQRLSELPRIAGIKDATADLARPLIVRDGIGPHFCQLSGDDITVLPFLAQGGHGCISVVSNVAPRLSSELHSAWQAGNAGKALALSQQLLPLHQGLFVDTNPVPVKFALAEMGLCQPDLRLPLVPLGEAEKAIVRAALRSFQLIS